ncbi:MAG: RNA-binding S4 domain-containing protein [Oscillospiraceae bacterium]|jgi:ribosomal 50S subunit-recycling heat shock protein
MRLDKFLKESRLLKRRTVANELCDAGKVLVNGRASRASREVAEGDIIEITLGQRTIKARVLSAEAPKNKDGQKAMSEIINN